LITPQTESTPLPYFSSSVTSKKQKQKNERERIEPENKQKKERGKDTKWLSHLGRFFLEISQRFGRPVVNRA
jgi:hypothetical protein